MASDNGYIFSTIAAGALGLIENLIFALEQYFHLLLLLLSIQGWGSLLSTRLLDGDKIPVLTRYSLQASIGLGVITLMIIALATFGALTTSPLIAILVTGLSFSVYQLVSRARMHKEHPKISRTRSLGAPITFLALLTTAAFLSNSLVRPLRLPTGWDELMYHLPIAKAWADSGSLLVTDWLRYPLFPFNMEALYAAGLILGNDITTHLLHALTGFLTVALTFSIARVFLPTAFSILTAVFLIYAIRQQFETADIDLGLMLYVFCSFVALGLCYINQRNSLCLLSAFFAGLALGTKYQSMFFLPALAFCFLMTVRSWQMISLAVLISVMIGTFWYARNYLVSGDPVHPIGGSVFGYWLWNADDIARQFSNLSTVQKPPPWYLLLSVGCFIFIRSAPTIIKGCIWATLISVLVWAIASRYDRYLIPMYPMLAILSGYFLHRLFTLMNGYEMSANLWQNLGKITQNTLITVFLLAITFEWGKSTIKDIRELILPDSPERMAFLVNRFAGYELLNDLRIPIVGTIYQLGFEDEIYYFSTPVLGDHFGTSRYVDVHRLVGDPAKLSSHLHSLGADYFLVNLDRRPAFIEAATSNPIYHEYFERVSKTSRAAMYRIKRIDKHSSPK